MTLARNIKWITVLFAAFSLVVVQLVHFGEADAAHTDNTAGHSHDATHTSGDGPADDHVDADHCATHGACHLLLHALGPAAQNGALLTVTAHANWRLSQYRVDGLTLSPPTPPPLT